MATTNAAMGMAMGEILDSVIKLPARRCYGHAA